MPTDDKDVRAALDSFGAVFNKRKGDANVVVRADPHLIADILAAVSDHVMPTNDMDVQAALASFGEVPKKNCNDANVAVFSPVWRCTATTSHSWSRR